MGWRGTRKNKRFNVLALNCLFGGQFVCWCCWCIYASCMPQSTRGAVHMSLFAGSYGDEIKANVKVLHAGSFCPLIR